MPMERDARDPWEDRHGLVDNRLPALGHDSRAWLKIAGILALLFAINVVAFLVSYGWGVIITLPLTILFAFLIIRDLLPRHRLPPGRPHATWPG